MESIKMDRIENSVIQKIRKLCLLELAYAIFTDIKVIFRAKE